MLNENIKAIRRSKGLSQQELAVKLNVVGGVGDACQHVAGGNSDRVGGG